MFSRINFKVKQYVKTLKKSGDYAFRLIISLSSSLNYELILIYSYLFLFNKSENQTYHSDS